jgi:hypothetical protein
MVVRERASDDCRRVEEERRRRDMRGWRSKGWGRGLEIRDANALLLLVLLVLSSSSCFPCLHLFTVSST